MLASHSNGPLTHTFRHLQIVKLCQLEATLSWAYCTSLDPNHILYGLLNVSSDACQERPRCRHLFVPAVHYPLMSVEEVQVKNEVL